jgi:hypothetical protein
MTMLPPSESIAERLVQLELAVFRGAKRERRWRWALLLTVGGLGVAALTAATDITRIDSIRTHRLEVLNADGQVVMSIGSDHGGGRLDLWSPAGANLARLASNDFGGDLALWNESGGAAVGVWTTQVGGTIAAWNVDGGRGATMAAGASGGTLSLGTSIEHVSLALSGSAEPSIHLHDSSGVDRTQVLAGSLLVQDPSTQRTLTLAATADGPSVSLVGDAGNTLLASVDAQGGVVAVGGEAGEFRVGSQAMRLTDDGTWSIRSGSQQVLAASMMDGIASLKLVAPGGIATLQAGPESRLVLAGADTESVTLASGPDAAILQTSDAAIRLHANSGAGSLRIGGGEAGGVRLTGGVDGMRPAVDVLGAGDVRVATLTTGRDGLGLLAVSDRAGTPVALLHGLATGHGRLAVHGPRGRAIADSAADGTPSFSLQTLDGRTLATMAATDRGGALNLMNADGTPVVLAGVTADGPGGAAAFQNGSGHTVVAAGSTAENVGRIVVEDSPSP